MTRGREGVWIPFKSDDVIYEQPLSTTIPILLLGQIREAPFWNVLFLYGHWISERVSNWLSDRGGIKTYLLAKTSVTKTLSNSSKKEKDHIQCHEVKGQQREGFLIKINITLTIIIKIIAIITIALHLEQDDKCLNIQVLGHCFKGEQTTSKQVASHITSFFCYL